MGKYWYKYYYNPTVYNLPSCLDAICKDGCDPKEIIVLTSGHLGDTITIYYYHTKELKPTNFKE